VSKALSERAPRITVHDVNETPVSEVEATGTAADVEIDWTALEKS
jgi:hypothetical protein